MLQNHNLLIVDEFTDIQVTMRRTYLRATKRRGFENDSKR